MMTMDGELAQGMRVRVIGGVNVGREGVLTDVWLAGALAGLVRLNGSLVVEAVNVEPLTPSEGSDDPAPEPVPDYGCDDARCTLPHRYDQGAAFYHEGLPFDAFEVHACLPLRVLDPGYDDDDAVEQVDDPDVLAEHAEHVIWSVYGHRSWPIDERTGAYVRDLGGRPVGLECLGDFKSEAVAMGVARSLAMTPQGVRIVT
jgi:hypothetical protein